MPMLSCGPVKAAKIAFSPKTTEKRADFYVSTKLLYAVKSLKCCGRAICIIFWQPSFFGRISTVIASGRVRTSFFCPFPQGVYFLGNVRRGKLNPAEISIARKSSQLPQKPCYLSGMSGIYL